MDGLQASHTHLTGCPAAQGVLDSQVETMALSARVGQLPCPASPLFAQKARDKRQWRRRCKPSGVTSLGLPAKASLAAAATQHTVCGR